jgi:hypothetical protein
MSDVDRWKKSTAIEILYDHIFKKYTDLPVTVGIIGADVDRAWVGSDGSAEMARKTFLLPHVEVGSHTYSHPFYWAFFKDYSEKKEKQFFSKHGNWRKNTFAGPLTASEKAKEIKSVTHEKPIWDYTIALKSAGGIPRAYTNKPYQLELEIAGSLDKASSLAPEGKRASLLQWTGDCQPYYKALAYAEGMGIPHINGGDTRLDTQYPSYSWVRSICRFHGGIRQPYAAMSNENTYTNLWTGPYFGFKQLIQTIQTTETPLRVKPLNLYYHVFTGEKNSSLVALKDNLEYIATQEIAPVEASYYAEMVKSYHNTNFDKVEENTYRVFERGNLQTVRFDRATFLGVDFKKSQGVIGQRHFQGSVYVYLDQVNENPLIALKELSVANREPEEQEIYLISSRWLIWNVKRPSKSKWQFTTRGYGHGKMTWKVPTSGKYIARIKNGEHKGKSYTFESNEHEIVLDIPIDGIQPLEMEVSKV